MLPRIDDAGIDCGIPHLNNNNMIQSFNEGILERVGKIEKYGDFLDMIGQTVNTELEDRGVLVYKTKPYKIHLHHITINQNTNILELVAFILVV